MHDENSQLKLHFITSVYVCSMAFHSIQHSFTVCIYMNSTHNKTIGDGGKNMCVHKSNMKKCSHNTQVKLTKSQKYNKEKGRKAKGIL